MPASWLTPETDGGGNYFCRRLFIPDDIEFIAAVNGALLALTEVYRWEKFGALNPQDAADLMFTMYNSYVESTGCMIGTVFPYATTTPPAHSLDCDGSTYLRTDYPALYAVLDAAFIVNADSFTVPDLRGRAVIGTGTGSGLSARSINDAGGAERVTLGTGEIPSHSHSEITAIAAIINGGLEAPASAAIPGIGSTGSTGGGGDHENMMPWRALGFAIWVR